MIFDGWHPQKRYCKGSTIVALVRDIKISDALTFPGNFCSTYMVQIEWYLIEFTLRNVSVRYDDYGPSKGH